MGRRFIYNNHIETTPATMNVRIDAISMKAYSGGWSTGNPKSWSHTISGGTNRIVMVYTFNDPATSVTYGGVSMTSLYNAVDTWSSSCWILLNPATGTNTISVTCTGGNGWVGAISYNGVNQTTPTGGNVAVRTITTLTTSFSITGNTSSSNSTMVGCAVYMGAVSTGTWTNAVTYLPKHTGTGQLFFGVGSTNAIPTGNYVISATYTAQPVQIFCVPLISS